ncbi:hypothetical protein PLAN_30142 [Planktothrix rubescens CCAP 1459/22]|uniref:Response regulatory domain-containing protein n=1 Tax=Planktothrix rubescens CCAP 1459/22 TaxID=329571 RepID=A0A6J7ZG58_PLARU|nr:response regulator [Planktothrix rubescens]CAC5342873.1 hypothetical protein PLAN_30142 [Planktothrix rubescens NIVA-CYA 18]CAD5974173.1 Protein PilG [Planktothrix rubescens NIVA-CYA 18]
MKIIDSRTQIQQSRLFFIGLITDALSTIYHEAVSVLLLDVAMPGIDGLELCRTVRSIPQFQNLPIIMLTSRDGAFDKVQGRLAGASEYLTKPFDAQKLSEVVSQVLQLQQINPQGYPH